MTPDLPELSPDEIYRRFLAQEQRTRRNRARLGEQRYWDDWSGQGAIWDAQAEMSDNDEPGLEAGA